MRTLVLLSGGLDSATVLAAMLKEGHDCSAAGFDYGQPHHIELDYAEELATHYRVQFDRVGLPSIFSARTDDVVFAGRNLVLAAMAISMAAARKLDAVAVGCNASDWERFPDCRPDFWSHVRNAATTYNVQVATPLIRMSKREVVELARHLQVPIEKTWSCYLPTAGKPCRECLACTVRERALECS
jgi:7-cyano-7-deazaguanine synthase